MPHHSSSLSTHIRHPSQTLFINPPALSPFFSPPTAEDLEHRRRDVAPPQQIYSTAKLNFLSHSKRTVHRPLWSDLINDNNWRIKFLMI